MPQGIYDRTTYNRGWDNNWDKNPRFKKHVTIESVIEMNKNGMTQLEIAEYFGVSRYVILRRFKQAGIKAIIIISAGFKEIGIRQTGHHVELDRAAAVGGVRYTKTVCQGAHLEKGGRAPGSPQVRLDDVDRAVPDKSGKLVNRVKVLAGSHGNREIFSEMPVAVDIVRGNRLFPPKTAKFLELLSPSQGFRRSE